MNNSLRAVAYASPSEWSSGTLGVFFVPEPTDQRSLFQAYPLRAYFGQKNLHTKSGVRVGKTQRDKERKLNRSQA